MKRLIFKTVSFTLCFLLAGANQTPTAYSMSRHGLKWWANVYARNNEYLEVTVQTEDDGRRYQNVWFDAAYFNKQGMQIGKLVGTFTDREGPQSVLQPGKTYRKYYKLNGSAASARAGTMHFTVIQPPVPLYRWPADERSEKQP